MAKTEQPRVPSDVMDAVRAICGAFGEKPNVYVTRVLREAIQRDTPKAAKLLAKRAQQGGKVEDE